MAQKRDDAAVQQQSDAATAPAEAPVLSVDEYIAIRAIPRLRQETTRHIALLKGGAHGVRATLAQWDEWHGLGGSAR